MKKRRDSNAQVVNGSRSRNQTSAIRTPMHSESMEGRKGGRSQESLTRQTKGYCQERCRSRRELKPTFFLPHLWYDFGKF